VTTTALPVSLLDRPRRGERLAGSSSRGGGERVQSGVDGRIEPAVDDVTSAAFFRAHYPRLAGWCRRLVDDDDTAHEIASEAFTRLVAKRRQLDDPRSYLYTIAVNLVRDHWRRTQRERRGLRQIIAGRPEQSIRPPGPDSELRLLVETLPDKLRGPVLLHYFGDFSIDDVARMLGRKAGTVKSQLFDARAVLRMALEDPAIDGPGLHHPQDRP
jgi:RNA polymerase sigma-70 factor (ECF subfamily)